MALTVVMQSTHPQRLAASVRVDFDAAFARCPSDGGRSDAQFAGDRLG